MRKLQMVPGLVICTSVQVNWCAYLVENHRAIYYASPSTSISSLSTFSSLPDFYLYSTATVLSKTTELFQNHMAFKKFLFPLMCLQLLDSRVSLFYELPSFCFHGIAATWISTLTHVFLRVLHRLLFSHSLRHFFLLSPIVSNSFQ